MIEIPETRRANADERSQTAKKVCYICVMLAAELVNIRFWARIKVCWGCAPAQLAAHLLMILHFPVATEIVQHSQKSTPVPASVPGRARHHYIDNVRIFCTVLVLVLHVADSCGGYNGLSWSFRIGVFPNNKVMNIITGILYKTTQPFIMSLLFFISGVFTPSSFERKGITDFVREKLKRLGWPLVVTFFIASPLSTMLQSWILLGDPLRGFQFNQAPCWFIGALLIFNISFAILPPTLPKELALPSVAKLTGACFCLGAFQGAVYYFEYDPVWSNISPVDTGGLPFDIAFFAAGCLAMRSGWLDAIRDLSLWQYWRARFICAVGMAILVIRELDDGAQGTAGWVPCTQTGVGAFDDAPLADIATSLLQRVALARPTGHRTEALRGPSQVESSGPLLLKGVWLFQQAVFEATKSYWPLIHQMWQSACLGMVTASASISILHWFAVHANTSGPVTQFLREAQYGVYVLQSLSIPLVMWTFVKLITAVQGRSLVFLYCDYTPTSYDQIGQVTALAGFLYTSALVNIVSWPFSHWFRKLPGVRDVL